MPKYEVTFMDDECTVLGVMEHELDNINDALEVVLNDWIPTAEPYNRAQQISIMLKEQANAPHS